MTALFVCIVSLTMAARASSFACGPAPARGASRGRGTATPSLRATKEGSAIGIFSTEGRTSVSRPPIHWTVPGFKVGWRDPEGNWHDEDGPRNGPPQNYWRQSADEREYDEAMGVVDAVLAEYDVQSEVERLERRCSARRPSLSRKVLGRWAPLLLSGSRIAFNDKPSDDGGEIEVPFMVDITRSNGRRFGPRNHYGIFDLKLENGEELAISTTAGNKDCESMVSAKVMADEKNEPLDLGTVCEAQLQFGGITYVSDYVLIQRRSDGAIDFFLRADKSHLGASDEEKIKYHLV